MRRQPGGFQGSGRLQAQADGRIRCDSYDTPNDELESMMTQAKSCEVQSRCIADGRS